MLHKARGLNVSNTNALAALNPEEVGRFYNNSIVVDGLASASTFKIMWPRVGPLTPEQVDEIVDSSGRKRR
jgi:hypothetical protein